MTARTVAAVSSLAVALGSAGCLSFYEIAVETPIQAKIDVSTFPARAGRRLPGGRLEEHRSQHGNGAPASQSAAHPSPTCGDRRRRAARSARKWTSGAAPPVAVSPQPTSRAIKHEQDLADYEAIFTDVDYWKKLGEEYQSPLIITGSIMFTEVSKSGVVSTAADVHRIRRAQVRYAEDRDVQGHEGLRADAQVRLHRRPDRRAALHRVVPRGGALRRRPEHARRCRPTSS